LADLEKPVIKQEHSIPTTSEARVFTPNESSQQRTHLFISYASEDGLFAEWLTLRLAAEGYKVWCDRTKLLGGESYPINIDDAIKESTFRVIALLSKFSVHKPNPVKERTLALSIGRERKIDFLIPLNVDGLRATELDWMTNDLTFIPFHEGWAVGLARLLKKLRQVDAPKFPSGAKQVVSSWVTGESDLVLKSEDILSNVFPISELPEQIVRYHVEDQNQLDSVSDKWAFFQPMDTDKSLSQEVWALSSPPPQAGTFVSRRESVIWKNNDTWGRIRPFNTFTYLARRNIEVYCIRKGLTESKRGQVYFPNGLLQGNRIRYPRYDGKQVNVNVVGERTFRRSKDLTEKRLYHLSPRFRLLMARFGAPTLQINLGIIWTDMSGIEDPIGRSNRRRKKLTRSWWNYEWLSRINATASWITDGQESCRIAETDHGNLEILTAPLRTQCPVGIDEEKLGPREETDDEEKVLDDLEEEDDVGEDLVDEGDQDSD
jgi:hypothetical protein